MRSTLVLAAIAIALRTALFYLGYEIPAFRFAPVHLLFIVLIAYACGHFTLKEDPETGLAELIRSGIREGAIYALLIGLFTWVFFTFINSHEIPDRVDLLVRGLMAEGHSEAEARAKVSGFFTANAYSLLTFMALLGAGAINAVFFGYVHHRVLRRFRDQDQRRGAEKDV